MDLPPPLIYLFSSFSKREAFSAVGCNVCHWLFPLFVHSFRMRGVVWFFHSKYSERREGGCVVSSLGTGHGPFSAFGTCVLLPRTFINHFGQIMGKGPHMKRVWWSLPNSGETGDFSAPPRIGTGPCKVQFQTLKTKSLGSRLL